MVLRGCSSKWAGGATKAACEPMVTKNSGVPIESQWCYSGVTVVLL
jgi:hypothetical protein